MKLNPFDGLNTLKIEEHKSLSVFNLCNEVESLSPSFQEGQTKDMFLFLYLINIFRKNNIDFLVKGGIILNMYLGKHARRTTDIDVYVADPNVFFEEVNKALRNTKDDFTYETEWIKMKKASKLFYHNTFAFYVHIFHKGHPVKTVLIDGMFTEECKKLEKVKYRGPKIIDEDFYFYGVNVEYVTAEKINAVVNELTNRQIKHLIDLYGLIKLDLNIDKLKFNLDFINKEEDEVRKSFDIEVKPISYVVRENKTFDGSYYFTALQAGYNLDQEEMNEEINNWFKNNL